MVEGRLVLVVLRIWEVRFFLWVMMRVNLFWFIIVFLDLVG